MRIIKLKELKSSNSLKLLKRILLVVELMSNVMIAILETQTMKAKML